MDAAVRRRWRSCWPRRGNPNHCRGSFAKLRSIGVDVRASHVIISEMARLGGLVASDRIQSRATYNGRPAKDARNPRASRFDRAQTDFWRRAGSSVEF
jgi:hypothetical protein